MTSEEEAGNLKKKIENCKLHYRLTLKYEIDNTRAHLGLGIIHSEFINNPRRSKYHLEKTIEQCLIYFKKFKLYSGAWDDLKFPASIQQLDLTTGRLSIDYFNGGVVFSSNARFDDEPISMLAQFPHAWKAGTGIRPHIHWLQQGSDEPNFLLAYKIMKNGEAITLETDYSNYTLLTKNSNAFVYSSGVLAQITTFGEIDTTGMKISDLIHFVLFRDSANASGEFVGADPSAIDEIVLEFDVHILNDTFGSFLEFSKDENF